MTDESEVSCYLCLQADEYGSMLKVSIIPPGFAPRPPLVICRSCGAEVARELWSVLEGENSPALEPVVPATESAGGETTPEALNPVSPPRTDSPGEAPPTESSAEQNSE